MTPKLLLEALPPEQEKRVAFSIGRYNPATSGHYKVFDAMKRFVKDHKELDLEAQLIVVVVEGVKSSEDKTKNPFTADERISFMQSSGRANMITFLKAKNGSQALGVIRDNGFEPIAIGAGSDRAEGYKKHLDRDFNKPDGTKIEHYIIPGLERASSAIETKKVDKKLALDATLAKAKENDLDSDEISGSLARRAAELGYFDEFTKIVGLEKKPNLSKIMYDKFRKILGIE